jgi:hemolysin-activating ACP:hemolysin acyltransferase
MKREEIQIEAETLVEAPSGVTITDSETTAAQQQRKQAERDLMVRLASASVADAVSLMMRSDRHRHYSLADLEWLLLPPLMLDQIAFAYSRPNLLRKASEAHQTETAAAETGSTSAAAQTGDKRPPIPIALVTWAAVSPEVAGKLDAQNKVRLPYRLAPNEWRSRGACDRCGG